MKAQQFIYIEIIAWSFAEYEFLGILIAKKDFGIW